MDFLVQRRVVSCLLFQGSVHCTNLQLVTLAGFYLDRQSRTCQSLFSNFHVRERVLGVTDDAAAFLVKPVFEETFVTRDRIFSH